MTFTPEYYQHRWPWPIGTSYAWSIKEEDDLNAPSNPPYIALHLMRDFILKYDPMDRAEFMKELEDDLIDPDAEGDDVLPPLAKWSGQSIYDTLIEYYNDMLHDANDPISAIWYTYAAGRVMELWPSAVLTHEQLTEAEADPS